MHSCYHHSLIEGDFENGRLLCLSLTEGDFWTRRQGCFCIYRGKDGVHAIGYKRILGVSTKAGLCTLPASLSHKTSTDYFYSVRRFSSTGKNEMGTMAVVKLSLDAAGMQKANRANPIRNLCAEQVEEGRIRLTWWYWPLGQSSPPDYFVVYGDSGTGIIDYEKALSEIAYNGSIFYRVLTESGADGKRYRFSVRTMTQGGVDDGNHAYIEVIVKLTTPDSLSQVQLTGKL